MTKNVGGLEKGIRIAAGIALLLVGIFAQLGSGLRLLTLVFSAVALTTAFTGF